MDKFSTITTFGNLTVNGQKLTFKDFDKNKDGTISKEEYSEVLKTLKSDLVEFNSIDRNTDSKISQEEFNLWEQKILMQEAVNKLATQISVDFSGKSEYLEELTESLKTLIDDFAKTYYGDISTMAENFEKELPKKYETVKNTILANDSSTISARVIYGISQQLSENIYNGIKLRDDIISKILVELNSEATRFLQIYTGSYLEYDLTIHLEEFLNSSEIDIMQEAINSYKENISGFDENSDIKEIKETVKKLLLSAIERGVTLNFGGYNILTEAAITFALQKYTDTDSLLQAVDETLSGLNTTKKLDIYIFKKVFKKMQKKKNKDLSIQRGQNIK